MKDKKHFLRPSLCTLCTLFVQLLGVLACNSKHDLPTISPQRRLLFYTDNILHKMSLKEKETLTRAMAKTKGAFEPKDGESEVDKKNREVDVAFVMQTVGVLTEKYKPELKEMLTDLRDDKQELVDVIYEVMRALSHEHSKAEILEAWDSLESRLFPNDKGSDSKLGSKVIPIVWSGHKWAKDDDRKCWNQLSNKLAGVDLNPLLEVVPNLKAASLKALLACIQAAADTLKEKPEELKGLKQYVKKIADMKERDRKKVISVLCKINDMDKTKAEGEKLLEAILQGKLSNAQEITAKVVGYVGFWQASTLLKLL